MFQNIPCALLLFSYILAGILYMFECNLASHSSPFIQVSVIIRGEEFIKFEDIGHLYTVTVVLNRNAASLAQLFNPRQGYALHLINLPSDSYIQLKANLIADGESMGKPIEFLVKTKSRQRLRNMQGFNIILCSFVIVIILIDFIKIILMHGN